MLHRLPDELLLQIARSISDNNGNSCLTNLALTHRSFHNIVRERLLRNAVIPLRSIPHFIVLISQHPTWASCIAQIELRDDSSEVTTIPYSAKAMAVCRKLISKTWKGSESADIQFALETYHASPVVWTAMLFAAVPNASGLIVHPAKDEMASAYEFVLRQYSGIQDDLLARLESYVQERLEAVDVKAPGDLHNPIAVLHLRSLRTLAVDGECLRPRPLDLDWRAYGARRLSLLTLARPSVTLPPSLQTLLVRGDVQSMPWVWLRELQWHQVDNRFDDVAFTRLRIRLCFSMSSRLCAKYVFHNPHFEAFEGIDVRCLLATWQIMPVDFKTYFQVGDDIDGFVGEERYEQRSFIAAVEAVRIEAMGDPLPWMGEEKERVREAEREKERERERKKDRWWRRYFS